MSHAILTIHSHEILKNPDEKQKQTVKNLFSKEIPHPPRASKNNKRTF